jgi:hypothetical protein
MKTASHDITRAFMRDGIQLFCGIVSAGIASRISRRLLSMRNRPFTLAYGAVLMFGIACLAVVQDMGTAAPGA